MKLTDLNPRWALDANIVLGGGPNVHDENRYGMAITFDCPHCRTTRLAVWFANPIDNKPATDNAVLLWTRNGDSFANLTLSPSINAAPHGHWHGSITNGEVA